jgi:hypothetical protein
VLIIIDQKVRLKKTAENRELMEPYGSYYDHTHEIAKQSQAVLNVSEYILHKGLHGFTYVLCIA